MKTTLKTPGTKRLKLKHDEQLSNFAFKLNLRRYTMAALVAQGCAEIRWLAGKMGARPETLSGISGTGDIMLTCFVNLSRNRTVGVRLGSGETLEQILGSMTQAGPYPRFILKPFGPHLISR